MCLVNVIVDVFNFDCVWHFNYLFTASLFLTASLDVAGDDSFVCKSIDCEETKKKLKKLCQSVEARNFL
jgi:hypothetical protein